MSLQTIIDTMKSQVWVDQAACMHWQLAQALEAKGLQVSFEKTVEDGRIDLVVEWQDGCAGIELDCRKPRKKSVKKLKSFRGYRIIGIRGIEGQPIPEGIDEVVTMRVRVPNQDEAADKRSVNRER